MSRDPQHALMIALAEQLGPIDSLTAKTRDWWSATFKGTRHLLRFSVPWRAKAVIAAIDLPDADLPIPGHFVADLRVNLCERRGSTLNIELEVLVIEEA
jgi:hypothetical protein